MADKTLYDVLEVSTTASDDTVRAAYERLSAKFDPAADANASNPAAKMQHDAVREAYLTLGNAGKRTQYDARLARARIALQNVEVVEPFWTLSKVVVAGIVVLVGSGFYYGHHKEQARLARVEAEKQIAVAKAKEAEEKARADVEQFRLQDQRRREEQQAEDRARRERDVSLQRFSAEQHRQNLQSQQLADRERMQKESADRRAESQRQMDESRARAAAAQQAQRDRAELCRIERERYGKSISC